MSKLKIELRSRVLGGRVSPSVREQLMNFIIGSEGKEISIMLSRVGKKRTNKQNAFYWGVVIPMVTEFMQEAGNDVDGEDVHLYLKGEVGKLREVIHLPSGEIAMITQTSTQLSTQEWEIYIEKIRRWAAEFSLLIPFPGESIASVNARNS